MIAKQQAFTLKCSGCGFTEDFSDVSIAENAARFHVQSLGREHLITCTKPAHDHPGAIPVIVFSTKIIEEAA